MPFDRTFRPASLDVSLIMKNVFFSDRRQLSRRHVLRGAGCALALPVLDAMTPAFARPDAAGPRRMVAIQTNQGIMPMFFFPEAAGRDYGQTDYLKILGKHRDQLTVFSGLSHPGVDGGHAADKCFLTGTPHPARGGFRNDVSLDQFIAEQVGSATRFPSLTLAVTNEPFTISFTRSGAPIPAENSPSRLFQTLFLQSDPKQVEKQVEALKQGRSMLDFISEQSARLNRTLGQADQQRLDQYFTSVRELERRMHASEAWQYKPKPKVSAPQPVDNTDQMAFVERSKTMFDLVKLALETDSTRTVALQINTTVIHSITHHGGREDVIAELKGHETRQFEALNHLLNNLADTQEGGLSLLDRTIVLYGTSMGSANSHSNYNLPVLLAGGGFKHGQHLACDTKNNKPLANVFVSLLQRLGIEADSFASSTGTMTGLELT